MDQNGENIVLASAVQLARLRYTDIMPETIMQKQLRISNRISGHHRGMGAQYVYCHSTYRTVMYTMKECRPGRGQAGRAGSGEAQC